MNIDLINWINGFTDKYKDCSNPFLLKRLDFSDCGDIKEIPLFLSGYEGILILSHNKIEKIPDDFIQNGSLFLNHNKIKEIPKKFKQNNVLDLSYNKIKKIPEKFNQNFDLYLSYNEIESIPKNFIQNGYLDLNNNKIKEIPEGFIQNGLLDLNNNFIEYISSDSRLDSTALMLLMDLYHPLIEKRVQKDKNKKKFISKLKNS